MAAPEKLKKPKTERCDEGEDTETCETENEQDDAKQVEQNIITKNREVNLQAYRDLLNESMFLQIRNNVLHRRLAEYYRKRELDHVFKPFQGTADLEKKYQQKLMSYEELKEKTEREIIDMRSKTCAVENNIIGRLEGAEKKFIAFQNLERSIGTGLIYSEKGKPIADKTVSRFITLQAQKSEQASTLSLRYIRARNAVAELEAVVRKLEIMGPGLSVHQYEQLNIENKNFKNKIEEREDELIKNRAKCTGHNQILAHIREKMHQTEELIDISECDLGDFEIEYKNCRGHLGEAKMKRNRLRWLLEAEQKKAGLLTRKDLLRDFQNARDEVVTLQKAKEALQSQIVSTSRQLREARNNTYF
ncbi:unnamed protein product [Arctia plantaginis]|uniref:CCDC113/CCDC96 coiled-coil domain-containing protein n=1 Tax=Arctia plantaginis TaxID=874455 RepID=A0A8S0YY64_ARCPL|nr:unnamed protein product [Arctia plantaginis]